MNEPIVDRVKDIIADLFLVPFEEIGLESSPETIERWDSIQHLNLVLAVEQTFGLQLSVADIERMTDVGAIVELVKKKLSD